MMSFFEPLPAPVSRKLRDRATTMPRWVQPPADEIPRTLPQDVVLGRSARAVLVVSRVEVYSDGCDIRFSWTVRRRDEDEAAWEAMGRNTHRPIGYTFGREQPLRYGVEFADGRRLLDTETQRWTGNADEVEGPRLSFTGGGGSGTDSTYDSESGLWLWPLPQGDSLRLVVSWEAMGVAECSLDLDAELIRTSAARVERKWTS